MRIVDIAADGCVFVEENGKPVYTGQDVYDYGVEKITREEVVACSALAEALVTMYAQCALTARLDDVDETADTMQLQRNLMVTLDKILSPADMKQVALLYTRNLEVQDSLLSGSSIHSKLVC